MSLKTRFITKEFFTQITGIDLDSMLSDHDAGRFICRVEDDMDTMLFTKIGKNVTWLLPHLNNTQKELFKKAVVEQVYYVFRNGDIRADSGYNPDSGKIADRKYLDSISMSPKAIGLLQQAGIWTLKLTGASITPFNIFPGNFGM